MIRTNIMPEMTSKSKDPRSDHPEAPVPREAGASARIVDSAELLGKEGEVLIRHDGRIYHLRRTRLGKLILTA